MANTDAFAMQRSDLNGFLFADVGVESNGMTLSVLSALARLGMDPWDEAGRLARQPKSAATEALARMIAALPASTSPVPDAMAIAARLVALLPSRSAPGLPLPLGRVSLLSRLRTGRPAQRGKPGGSPARPVQPSALVLALLAGLLAGLTVYLVLQRWATNLDAAPVTTSDTIVPGPLHKGA